MTTDQVRERLRRRYLWPRYLLIEEVADGTGGSARRFADALALALWPSDNLWLYGFEIKTDRADLLKELKQPKKWRGVGRYCDYWWLACSEGVFRGWVNMTGSERDDPQEV